MSYKTWNRTEEMVIRQYWNKYPIQDILTMLPGRSAPSVQRMAKALGMLDAPTATMEPAMAPAQTIPELERQLKIRKLQLDVDSASQALSLLENGAIKAGLEWTPELQRERQKLASRLSQLSLSLFKAKLA